MENIPHLKILSILVAFLNFMITKLITHLNYKKIWINQLIKLKVIMILMK
jgi:hypothetical protein